MPRRPSAYFAALALAGLVVTAACTDTAASPPATDNPPAVPVTARVDDGILVVGVLIPQGSASIGDAIHAGTFLAGQKINASKAFGEQGMRMLEFDEGVVGAGGVDPAITTLIDDKVDAIVGPASSTNALAGLGAIVDAGVVACSPTASSSLLDDFPDQGLFFRTIPSDSLQAQAMAEAVDQTGASKATVAYIDDEYGARFLDSVSVALRQRGIEQTDSVPYASDNKAITEAAKKVASIGAGVVVVVGDATSGPVMLGAIDHAEPTLRPRYVVNDAMRRPSASTQPISAELALRVRGVSPIAYSTDANFVAQLGATAPSPFAANAYDCVNLIALAALQARSTRPADIAANIPGVSSSGSPCMSFVECRNDLVAGSNINYDGPDGSLNLDSKGEVTQPPFELFGFDESGRDIALRQLG